MECRILYLYDDLMNLYGESGNIRVLTRHLEDQGFTVAVDRQTLGDSLRLSGYTLIYLGSGTESARNAALSHLAPYRGDLREAVKQGTILLFTGNAWEMLGASITTGDGEMLPGLGLFPFTVTESGEKRVTGDVIADCAFLAHPLVGFINKCSEAHGVETPLFQYRMGEGNEPGDPAEGIHSGTVYGTHLTGPVLVRNPHFMRYLIEQIGSRCREPSETGDPSAADAAWSYRPVDYPYEQRAYEITLSELTKRIEP